MIDFDAGVAPEQAGDTGLRRFVRGRARGELHRSQPRRRPDQRGTGDQPAQIGKARILVGADQIAHRDFAGELAGEFETGAGLGREPLGVARKAEPVEHNVVDPRIGIELDERLEPRRDLVAGASLRAVLIVVAILVAERSSVGEQRVLIIEAIDAALERNVQPVEAPIDAGSAADVGVGGELGEAGLQVGAAGILRRQQIACLEIDASISCHVDAGVELCIHERPVGERNRGILGVAAANLGGELVPFPIGIHFELRSDDQQRGAAPPGTARGVAVVACRDLDRRPQQEGAGPDPDGVERIVFDGLARPPWVRAGNALPGRIEPIGAGGWRPACR